VTSAALWSGRLFSVITGGIAVSVIGNPAIAVGKRPASPDMLLFVIDRDLLIPHEFSVDS